MRACLLVCLLLPEALSLPQCTRVQACSGTLNQYPLIEDDFSGWGSGMFPLYDEAFETASFDYNQTPEIKQFQLCECTNNRTCDSSNEDRNLQLDRSIMLTFCDNVEQQLALECKGHRGLLRVIGPAHPSGETISAVSSTAVFCNCPGGFQRLRAEHWGGADLSINYKCF